MPIYAYKCSSCGHAKDVLQKMSDAPLTRCPACGAETFAKQLTAAGFQLKGSGWYATDFRNGSKPPADAARDGKAETTGDGKVENKTDTKSDNKTDTKSDNKSDTQSASKSDSKSGTKTDSAAGDKPKPASDTKAAAGTGGPATS